MSSSPSRKRTDMACVNCRQRKIKCESNKPQACRNCLDKNKICQYIPVAEDAHITTRHSPPAAAHSPSYHGHSSSVSPFSPNGSQYHSQGYSNGGPYSPQGYVEPSSPIQDQFNVEYAPTSYTSTVPAIQAYPDYRTQSYSHTGEISSGIPSAVELSPVPDVVHAQYQHSGHVSYVEPLPTYGYVSQSPTASSTPRYQTDPYQNQPSAYVAPQVQDAYNAPFLSYNYDNRGTGYTR